MALIAWRLSAVTTRRSLRRLVRSWDGHDHYLMTTVPEERSQGLVDQLRTTGLAEHFRSAFLPPPEHEDGDAWVAWTAETLAAIRGGETEDAPDQPADLYVGACPADVRAAHRAEVPYRAADDLQFMTGYDRADLLRRLE